MQNFNENQFFTPSTQKKSSSSNVPLEMAHNYQIDIYSMSIGASEKKIRQLVQTSLFCYFSKKRHFEKSPSMVQDIFPRDPVNVFSRNHFDTEPFLLKYFR